MQEQSSNYKIVKFAKILILFSFVLLFVGGFLCYKENLEVTPISITTNEDVEDDNVISVDNITSNEETVVNPEDNNDSNNTSSNDNNVSNTNTNTGTKSNTNTGTTKNNDNKGNSKNNNNNNVQDNSSSKKEQDNDVIENTPITPEESNYVLKMDIEKKYGVKIIYGAETEGYSIPYENQNISTTPVYDTNLINNSLIKLKNSLNLYPDGLFKEIKDGGIPLTVILINSFSDNLITGVTDSSYSSASIVVAVAYPFEETFYHESYHYIERYMFKRGANFNSWNSMNPSNFNYGTVFRDLSYSNTFRADAYFVNTYAQTDDKEDRASTFEYMMAPSKALCLNNGNPVWQKAVFMSRTIEATLDSASPNNTEYWERFLY